MKMIIHSNSQNEIIDQLKNLILDKQPGILVESVASNPHLSERLNRPLNNVSILISFIDDASDIDKLLSLKPLLDNTKQILILPDRSRNMVESGLQLTPSYISYQDSDFTDVLSVVERIYEKGQRSL